MRRFAAAALVSILASSAMPGAWAGQILVDLGRGNIVVDYPSTYDPARPYPLVLNLHGYTNTGQDQENYFQLTPLAESEEFIYAYPQGLSDFFGNPYWNGTDACCDLFGSGVDDSTYLINLVDEIRDQLNVDPWRVHFTGWSNGGFMSYRMACDHADTVASLVSVAGATYLNAAACTTEAPVHVLQVHGTNDGTILYGGGATTSGTYPGALQTAETWAGYNGCSLVADLGQPNRDVDAAIAGDEATVRLYDDRCTLGGSSQLWTVPDGPHGPSLSVAFRQDLVEYLLRHRKTGLRFDDRQTLVWQPLRWAQSYRVYRGMLSDLFDNDADGLADPGYGDCASAADPDPTDTQWIETDVPPPGGGYFYLVGFEDGNGVDSVLGTAPAGPARIPAVACP